jgi:hypothetical protein
MVGSANPLQTFLIFDEIVGGLLGRSGNLPRMRAAGRS